MVEHPSDPSVADLGLTLRRAWAEHVAIATVDPKTMSLYDGAFRRHVEPVLGGRDVVGLTSQDVEELLEGVRVRGASPSVVRLVRLVVAVACRRALALGVISRMPTDGVRAVRSVAPPARVLTPEEFVLVRDAMPTTGARLLAEVLVRSGLRIGEALALAVDDVDGDALLVSRSLSEPGRRYSADGQRFVIRASTKNGAARRVVVGRQLGGRLEGWVAGNGLQRGDLVFPGGLVLPPSSGREFPRPQHREPLTEERLRSLGTFRGSNGRTYQHGTVNGYATGRCREACCRQAMTEYSAARRRARRGAAGVRPARGAESPAPLGAVTPQGWARVWKDAVRSAGLDFEPLPRQTRHAHASWLNDGGVSVEKIAARLGHRDERSTRGYVRPVWSEPDAVTVLDGLFGDTGAPPDPVAGGSL